MATDANDSPVQQPSGADLQSFVERFTFSPYRAAAVLTSLIRDYEDAAKLLVTNCLDSQGLKPKAFIINFP